MRGFGTVKSKQRGEDGLDIREFAQALQSKDRVGTRDGSQTTFSFTLRFTKEPMVGREAVTQVLQLVFSIFETFHYSDVVPGGPDPQVLASRTLPLKTHASVGRTTNMKMADLIISPVLSASISLFS